MNNLSFTPVYFFHFRRTLVFSLFFFLQSLNGQTFTIASYNVENLMDTLDNPHANDNDFLPGSKNDWNTSKYWTKINHLGKVIADIGSSGPDLLGLCEIENRSVLNDLVACKSLKNKNYSIIHVDSKDERGIDCALLYKPDKFTVISWKTISAALEKIPTHTRDILVVKGVLHKDTILVMVNHWPSRRGGKEQTEHKRLTMALLAREVVDSVYKNKLNFPVLLMGDFNDEPTDKSIKEILMGAITWEEAGKEGLLNPFEELMLKGEGSLMYQKKWNMLDQILLNHYWRNGNWKLDEYGVFHPTYLHYELDRKQGPFKTFNNGKYKGGYSDHFPVYIVLKVRN